MLSPATACCAATQISGHLAECPAFPQQKERDRDIHYVHWASKAYEDESVFMSEAHLGWQ